MRPIPTESLQQEITKLYFWTVAYLFLALLFIVLCIALLVTHHFVWGFVALFGSARSLYLAAMRADEASKLQELNNG